MVLDGIFHKTYDWGLLRNVPRNKKYIFRAASPLLRANISTDE